MEEGFLAQEKGSTPSFAAPAPDQADSNLSGRPAEGSGSGAPSQDSRPSTVSESFAALFQKFEEQENAASHLPWDNRPGAAQKKPLPEPDQPAGGGFGFGPPPGADNASPFWQPPGAGAPGKGESNGADRPDESGNGGSSSKADFRAAAADIMAHSHPTAPAPSTPAGGSSRRSISPLLKIVLLLGVLFIGGIYGLRAMGGVEGAKSLVLRLLNGTATAESAPAEPANGPATPQAPAPAPASGSTPAPPTPDSSTPPPSSGADQAVPATPADQGVPATPVAPTPVAPAEATPVPAAESAEPKQPTPPSPPPAPLGGDEEAAPNSIEPAPQPASPPAIGNATVQTASVSPSSTPPAAPPASPDDAVPATEGTLKSALPSAEGSHAASASPAPPKTVPDGDAEPGNSDSEDPGPKMAAILEPIGTEVIETFYRAQSIDERVSFVLSPEQNQSRMEAYYRRYQALPTLRSVSFRGPMRDAASGRWFGVFDVRENENEELHRWCVVQVRPGEMKLDWVIYQQLIDESLDRFLADPASPAKEFRLVVRRGEEAPTDENPWQGKTFELALQPPLDTGQPRVILVREKDFEALGLHDALIGGNARIGRFELSWIASEIEPQTRVPTISKVLGWGAW